MPVLRPVVGHDADEWRRYNYTGHKEIIVDNNKRERTDFVSLYQQGTIFL
jgi:hypothetical protein